MREPLDLPRRAGLPLLLSDFLLAILLSPVVSALDLAQPPVSTAVVDRGTQNVSVCGLTGHAHGRPAGPSKTWSMLCRWTIA
jgi:hypothetical protein